MTKQQWDDEFCEQVVNALGAYPIKKIAISKVAKDWGLSEEDLGKMWDLL